MFYMWLGIVILLTIIEISTINLVSIWFIISGMISLVLSLFIDSFILQFSIFVIVGSLLLVFTRKFISNKLVSTEKTNLDRVIGMKGVVTEDIDDMVVGEVVVDGKRWSAISKEQLKKGDKVKILEIKGVKLIVERY